VLIFEFSICSGVLAHPPRQFRDFDAFRCANTSYHVNFRVFKFSMCPGGLAHPTTLILGFSTWWVVQPMLSSRFLTCSGVPIPYRVDFRIFGVSRIYLGTLYIIINILILWLSVKNPWPVPVPVVRGLPVTCGIPHSGFPLGSLCTMCLGHLHLRLTTFDWLVHTILQNNNIWNFRKPMCDCNKEWDPISRRLTHWQLP